MAGMERVIDKLVLLAFCAFVATMRSFTTTDLVAMLVAICAVTLFEVYAIPHQLRVALPLAYIALSLLFPWFLVFVPLVGYDCFQLDSVLPNTSSILLWVLRLSWLLPLIIGSAKEQLLLVLPLYALSALACLRAWQRDRLTQTLADYRTRRDELSALSQVLESKNRDLEERQALALRLATLAERSRIAREIHDNVGHLLTRSVLQTEALRVLYTEDDALTEQLTGISQTLTLAYETVRESVHDLHEESFELHTQLQALARETEGLPRPPATAATVAATIAATSTTAVLSPATTAAAAVHSPATAAAATVDTAATLQSPATLAPLQVQISCELQDNPPPQSVSYSILAIAREAFSNTIKHSNATQIRLSLTEFPGFYQLIIQDNGSNPPATNYQTAGTGIGLSTMQERANALGGVLRTSYANGFRVFVSIPKKANIDV